MGTTGDKNRKRHPDAHTVAHTVEPSDDDRVFGHFENSSPYSPMGSLERQGLFFRQLARRRNDKWKVVGYILVAIFLLPLALAVFSMIASLF